MKSYVVAKELFNVKKNVRTVLKGENRLKRKTAGRQVFRI